MSYAFLCKSSNGGHGCSVILFKAQLLLLGSFTCSHTCLLLCSSLTTDFPWHLLTMGTQNEFSI